MTAALQKHSPLYLQVRDRLIERIEEGQVDPSGKLPSEHEICREFQVSRTTARLAVEELIEQGLVVRLPGKGPTCEIGSRPRRDRFYARLA